MGMDAPRLYRPSAADVVARVQSGLASHGWQGQAGGAGWALVHLFGRLAELIIARLNQVPDKYFLAFLNEAGVERLPSRPASTDLTFTLQEGGPAFIRVPVGTQVATVQTATQPEVVFETQRDIVVAPCTLVKCIAFDPLSYSDNTPQATGQIPGSFAPFQGQQERERILYLGDDALFAFSDAASRKAATITLSLEFAVPGNPLADGDWKLEWLYWNGTIWADLESGGGKRTDNTEGFSKTGDVLLSNLPELTQSEVDGKGGLWIACKLTGGTTRHHLPVLRDIKASRTIEIATTEGTANAVLNAIRAGTAFVPLDPAGEFFPLGQRPARLDTFYLRADEAFTKQGATVTLQMDLVGVPTAPEVTTELDKLEVVWEYHGADGWTVLGSSKKASITPARLNFEDTTNAFTASGSPHIAFRVPKQGAGDPLFAKTKVNDQEGYWVRARVTEGSYDVPGGMQGTPPKWVEPKTYAPLITKLRVKYSDYTAASSGPKTIANCRSRVDGMGRDHVPALTAKQGFAPFSAPEEGPALYLGFQQAFPAGEWIQLLLEVEEETQPSGTRPVFWEYWNGSQWAALRASDGTRNLRERGYLGFFGPADHHPSTEFGQHAYWLRSRPQRHPLADPGEPQTIIAGDDEVTVTLDASGSRAFDRQAVTRYIWRLVSSSPPTAEAGLPQTVMTPGEEAIVHLNASASHTLAGRSIVKYIWRLREPTEPTEETTTSSPFLKAIRPNTAPALNAVTIKDEVLGSSNGKPAQAFTLLRPPVLPAAQIAVREPDQPPAEELDQLQQELQESDEKAQALLPAVRAAPGEGVWVRWHQVADFHASTPASRHFTLDPISGRVRFGDGEQGKVPPVGRDNVKAALYRTHDGGKGNAAAGTITALRNPSGDLAQIKAVTNSEPAGGGSDAKPVEEVRQRGPQSLKHRQRAVTGEDFAWLAREASGEVLQARCLPTKNPLGLPEVGWVTVVITPESKAARPVPSPALLRQVQTYLADRALTNLKEARHIHNRGPEYIEATVLARVVPSQPEKADEIELAVLERLESFLHPLRGGQERTGWELGRDVYISEVYAEIEAVPGVDHVAGVRLLASLQQHRLRLKPEKGGYRRVPFDVPAGSQVSTFDERIKLLLAEPLSASDELMRLDVYGFKAGDRGAIVAADNTVLKDNLTIASVSGDRLVFAEPFDPSLAWAQRDALRSADGGLRLPLNGEPTVNAAGKVVEVKVRGFAKGDRASVVSGSQRHPDLEFLPIEEVEPCEDRIFVPEGHLICSGSHDIEMVLE